MVILGRSKRTEPEDSIDLRFRGLTLPLDKKPGGYLQSMYTRDIIRSSIFMILSTVKGERVFLPSFGSNLFKLVFEPNDVLTRNLIKQIVTDDVLRWEKRVSVTDVRVSGDDNEIKVYVEYQLNNTSILDATVLSFSQRTLSVSLAES